MQFSATIDKQTAYSPTLVAYRRSFGGYYTAALWVSRGVNTSDNGPAWCGLCRRTITKPILSLTSFRSFTFLVKQGSLRAPTTGTWKSVEQQREKSCLSTLKIRASELGDAQTPVK